MYVSMYVSRLCVYALRDTKSLVRLARKGLALGMSERREFEE